MYMSCLFNSLHYFIPSDSSYTIRQKICDYLQNNNTIMDGLDTDAILQMESANGSDNESANGSAKYIERMRLTSTWGGAIEIQVACNLWNFRIIVKNNRVFNHTTSTSTTARSKSEIEFLPITPTEIKNTIQLEWTGGHYEPVRLPPISENDIDNV